MDSIYVRGGIGLCGKVKIQGSKNAALPILAATILTGDRVVIQNCPKISDVYGMVRILESLGCKARWEKDALALQTDVLLDGKLPREDMGSMRSSIFLLGSLLGRTGHAELTAPGGCVIGKRPIDIHIQALEQMGVSFWEEAEILHARADAGIHGCDVTLASPSVGATENVVLCAVTAEGSTILRGAAREPEVQELCRFLNALGARIEGIGETVLTIEGVQRLKGATHRIPADRIVAGTYLLSGFVTGGEIYLEEAPIEQMEAVIDTAQRMGANVMATGDGIYIQYPRRAGVMPFLETAVYPGFPTDLQSVLLAVRCTGEGSTILRENIFENRFRVVEELRKMGADIEELDEKSVLINGISRLKGSTIISRELRGGAALVVAALGAKGGTWIHGRHFIDRGYENIARDFRELGARIVSG